MIAAWMLYTVAVTFLLLAGASAAEYVARALRAPTRVIWAVAMIAAVVLPARALSAGFATERATVASATVQAGVATLSGDARPASGDATGNLRPDFLARVTGTARAVAAASYRIEQSATRVDVRALDHWNSVLMGLWLTGSAVALLWFAGLLFHLRRIERGLVATTVRGCSVLVSRNIGPTVLG